MTPAEIFIKTAKEAGCPREQVEHFLTYSYVPFKWQLKFHAVAREADLSTGPTKIGGGGSRGGGKSTCIFAQVALDDCQRIPYLKCLFLRQTGKTAKESFEDLIQKVLLGKINYDYNRSNNVLTFKGGSKILLGGFDTERDIDKYIGIEYDLIAIEEMNQLTEEKVIKLLGSMRSSKQGWRPRLYSSFNPGGIGGAWIKKEYILPFRLGNETETRFIPAKYIDNPELKPEYINYLQSLTGDLGRMWREGDWDVLPGQFFDNFRRDKHIIRPFAIPEGWRLYRAYDHGRNDPACCLWFALDFDGNVIVYREFYQNGLDVDGIANKIKELSGNEKYSFSVSDPSIFSATGMVDKGGTDTIGGAFARRGINFFRGSNRRADGWDMVYQYLASGKLQIFENCVNLIREIPDAIRDEHQVEDIDAICGNHCLDSCRYFLMAINERKTKPPMTIAERKLKEWVEHKHVNPVFSNQGTLRGIEAFKQRYKLND